MWWSAWAGKLEESEQLDKGVDSVSSVLDRVLPPGPVKDALHGRWLGHQLHPLLVALPIGMWSGVSLLDFSGDPGIRRAAQRLVGLGVLTVPPTAASGLADWSGLGGFQRPKRVGLVHASSNVLTSLVYTASWWARRNGHHGRGRALALLGMGGLLVGGYLGGHLTYSQGVGVDRNADEQKAPRDWTDAGSADEVGEGELRRVEVAGQQVLLARRDGEVHAIGAVCSHLGGPLEQGELVDADGPCVVCPWHGSHFRLADGSVARGPATSPQTSYDVRTQDGRLQVKVRV